MPYVCCLCGKDIPETDVEILYAIAPNGDKHPIYVCAHCFMKLEDTHYG